MAIWVIFGNKGNCEILCIPKFGFELYFVLLIVFHDTNNNYVIIIEETAEFLIEFLDIEIIINLINQD